MYGGRGAPMTPNEAQSQGWFAWLCEQPVGRIIEREGQAVGEIRLHTISEPDQSARLALGLFDEAWLGQGIGRAAIQDMLAVGFETMGLRRIELAVMAFNTRAIRCYTACGFQHEGTRREAVRLDDGWHDEWIMGLLSRDYQKIKNEQRERQTPCRKHT